MLKDAAELSRSVQQLEQNLLHCFPYDAFGDDNIAKITVMIDVIKMDRSEAWINSKFLTSAELLMSHPNNVMWQAAMDAREWLNGSLDISDLLFPEQNKDKSIETALLSKIR